MPSRPRCAGVGASQGQGQGTGLNGDEERGSSLPAFESLSFHLIALDKLLTSVGNKLLAINKLRRISFLCFFFFFHL